MSITSPARNVSGSSAHSAPPSKPDILEVRPDGIPEQLKDADRWVVWRLEPRLNDRGEWYFTKVPYIAIGGVAAGLASHSKSSTWSTYYDAIKAYGSNNVDGVGFVLGDGWGGVDLDGCIDKVTGDITHRALRVLSAFAGTYTELSPRKAGFKLFCRGGVIPGPNGQQGTNKGWIEVYGGKRFFTVTGWQVGDLEDCK